jgi:heme/copper-type cytochrome/quinol oxidase subunit 2
MTLTRRSLGFLLFGAGTFALAGPLVRRLFAAAQDQAPNRREFSIGAHNYAFAPDRLEVIHDDLVKITVQSSDQAHSFTIDEYRIAKRIPAGGATTFEFRADRPGTFAFYCNLTSDTGCRGMRGQLVVRPK